MKSLYPEAGEPWRVPKLYYTSIPLSFLRKAADMAREAGMPPPFGVENPEDLPFVTPDEWITTTVDIRDAVRRKRQALVAHHSQIGPDWPMLAIPEEVNIEHFGTEAFQLVISRVPVTLPETDVFAGVTAKPRRPSPSDVGRGGPRAAPPGLDELARRPLRQKTSSSPASMRTLGRRAELAGDVARHRPVERGAARPSPPGLPEMTVASLPEDELVSPWRSPPRSGGAEQGGPAPAPDQSDGPFQEPAYQASWRCPRCPARRPAAGRRPP